jgi:2-polyprenyl-3-methyl-5-hydroxy-6-metoxy-1,4-benzoquinol methylase
VRDPIFAHPRLAPVYDAFDGDRDDLTAYLSIAGELGAERVLDVGCGTGCLAILLAESGRSVMGVDPARASLEVASLVVHGYRVLDVRQAPDRPGREFVFVAERTT